MASDRTNVPSSSYPGDLGQEFLHLLLEDDASYPWEPEASAAAAFFSGVEDEWVNGQTQDEIDAINAQGNVFFSQLDQAWATSLAATSLVANNSLQAQLLQHFGDRVPQAFIDGIVQQASTLFKTQQPLADQLVQCVQNLLSGWATDDLMVLARPYAYAMRGTNTDTLEAALRSVRYAAWTELSGVEQARLSLAIARYTISQLSSQDMP